MSDLLFFAPKAESLLLAPSASEMRSETILSEDTSVVKIAAAMSTPHTAFNPNFSATAKTGIDECIPSAKTTVCSINSIANRQMLINAQDMNICL